MGNAFGSKDLIKFLEKKNFTLKPSNHSSHLKYYPPKDLKVTNNYPFMTVQLGRKKYDPYACSRYIQELKKFGFSKKELEKEL